ncbi:Aste57867_25367 [Aphanomyces stellatus]|uniref:Aste57867_25367 protein n=1 Tax=Aphanomyces stellatus TaxID=120398 RepID=A0A485LSV9_9STRA|nr:hypothetical protein As57867_025289 [Aphanomyces stellatus]VFU01992.1 Aste57867_25367 [Aphanomyces stellatus]
MNTIESDSWVHLDPNSNTTDNDEALARLLEQDEWHPEPSADDDASLAYALALAAQFEEDAESFSPIDTFNDNYTDESLNLAFELAARIDRDLDAEAEEEDAAYFEEFEAPPEERAPTEVEHEPTPRELLNAPPVRERARRVSFFAQSSKSTLRRGVRIDID